METHLQNKFRPVHQKINVIFVLTDQVITKMGDMGRH